MDCMLFEDKGKFLNIVIIDSERWDSIVAFGDL